MIVTTGFAVEEVANMTMNAGDKPVPVKEIAMALQLMANESPVFKLNEVFDVEAVPL